MAAGSLLTLLDDIAALLDDVAIMSKMAVKKTAGVLGDDLALNAEQVTGVQSNRELAVVWAVFKGSLLNKMILVPAALAISAFAPWLVTPLLMVGGAYLCYEGFEKVVHKVLHKEEEAAHIAAAVTIKTPEDLVAFERDKIKGAVRTDFILSAEIIAITLGVVQAHAFLNQVLVLSGIAIGLTIGVYGLVAAIVRLDDLGLYLAARRAATAQKAGAAILWAAPWLMKGLSFFGTIAMFLVGGGILVHGVPALHHAIEGLGGGEIVLSFFNGLTGLIAGAFLVGAMLGIQRLRR